MSFFELPGSNKKIMPQNSAFILSTTFFAVMDTG